MFVETPFFSQKRSEVSLVPYWWFQFQPDGIHLMMDYIKKTLKIDEVRATHFSEKEYISHFARYCAYNDITKLI